MCNPGVITSMKWYSIGTTSPSQYTTNEPLSTPKLTQNVDVGVPLGKAAPGFLDAAFQGE
jgi:hypothetical protein